MTTESHEFTPLKEVITAELNQAHQISTPTLEPERRFYRKINVEGIPPRYHGRSFDDYVGNVSQVDQAREALAQGRGLYLWGIPGCGKTHMAVALARIWYEWQARPLPESVDNFPFSLIFLPSVEFFLEIKSTFGSEGRTESDVVNYYNRAHLLIIDDVGAEKVTDWSRQMFYLLIDRRYRDMKQTIITSNLSLGELSKSIDDRIASRITEMGDVIELDAIDHRLKGVTP